MHESWWNSFEQFLADVGRKPFDKTSIGRIDPNGHYEPGNVRWESDIEQARSKRNSLVVLYGGSQMLLIEVAEANGIAYRTLWSHMTLFKVDADAAVATLLGGGKGGYRAQSRRSVAVSPSGAPVGSVTVALPASVVVPLRS